MPLAHSPTLCDCRQLAWLRVCRTCRYAYQWTCFCRTAVEAEADTRVRTCIPSHYTKFEAGEASGGRLAWEKKRKEIKSRGKGGRKTTNDNKAPERRKSKRTWSGVEKRGRFNWEGETCSWSRRLYLRLTYLFLHTKRPPALLSRLYKAMCARVRTALLAAEFTSGVLPQSSGDWH